MLSVFEYYNLQETPSDVLEPNIRDQEMKGDITPSYGFQCISILEHADPPLISELEESVLRHIFNIQFQPNKDTYFYTHVP